jgi:hypothetical protein
MLGAGSASALPYFDGPKGFGFDNQSRDVPLQAEWRILVRADWRPAGSLSLNNDGIFEIVLRAKQKIIQKDDFFKVKVKWTIKNVTDDTIDNALLFFSALASDSAKRYGRRDFDIRAKGRHPFDIITYTDEGVDFFFAGWAIEDFEPGHAGRVKRKFVYKVDGKLIKGRAPFLGVAASFNPVPEPATGLLMVIGLTGLVYASRRRRCA